MGERNMRKLEDQLQQWQLSQYFLHQPLLLPLLLCTAVLVIMIARRSSRPGRRRAPPPSPPKLPIIGNLHQLRPHAHRSLLSLAAEHGPLMLVHLGSAPIFVASTAATAREIMKTHDLAFSSRPATYIGERLLYHYKDVSIAPYGEYWRQARRVCVVHLLSAARLRSVRAVREEEVLAMLDRISRSSDGRSSINLSEAVKDLTMGITGKVTLGKRDWTEGEGQVRTLIAELLVLLGTLDIGEYVPWLAWVGRLSGFDARVERCARGIDQFLERVVEDHLRRMTGGGGGGGESFLDVLLSVDEESERSGGFCLGRIGIRAIVLDMFSAGTHTTATVIDWAMTVLMAHPLVMQKLQSEVRRIGGEKPVVSEDDIEQMGYLKSVVKEVLRLYPPFPLLVPRESIEDVDLHGFHVPKGSRVIINAWAVGRDPEAWERPEEFWPERFVDSLVDFKGVEHFQFIPFGAGRRGCPGALAAVQVIELAVANLVYQFDWELPEGVRGEDLDMTEASGLTTARRFSLVLNARPRPSTVTVNPSPDELCHQ